MKIRELPELPAMVHEVACLVIEKGGDGWPRIIYDPFVRAFYAIAPDSTVQEVAIEDFIEVLNSR